MTQSEKTEAAIQAAYSRATLAEITGQVEIHARDLARKLDAVAGECSRWPGTTWAEAITAIIEPTP